MQTINLEISPRVHHWSLLHWLAPLFAAPSPNPPSDESTNAARFDQAGPIPYEDVC